HIRSPLCLRGWSSYALPQSQSYWRTPRAGARRACRQLRIPMPTSRRQFVATATGAIGAMAFPAIVPASVRGAFAPSNRIEVAPLGTGRQAMRPNLPQFLEMPDVQVVAVCDVDHWRLEQARLAVDAGYAEAARS